MSLKDVLRRPRIIRILTTIRTPSGLTSPSEVAACLKELVNDQGKCWGNRASSLMGIVPPCFDGYECVTAEPHQEPAAPEPTTTTLGGLPRLPALSVRRPVYLPRGVARKAFVGHSFLPSDKRVADCVIQGLTAIGIEVATGEKPKADKISDKIRKLIEEQHLFVGVFTRRDKIAHKKEWTTTSWVQDEKAYAVAKGKKLILIKEEGVKTIGDIQGDYEFIEFTRERLEELLVKLVQLFEVTVTGLKQ